MSSAQQALAAFKAAGVTSAATWSATNKNSNIAVTGSGLIATASGAGSTNFTGRATTATAAIGAGVNRFWKVTMTTFGPNVGIGFCTAVKTFADADYMGSDTESIGWYPDGSTFFGAALLATGPAFTQGDTIGFACQGGGSGKWWFYKNGSFTGDPAAGTGGQSNGFATCYPSFNLYTGNVITATFALSDAPAGFSAFP